LIGGVFLSRTLEGLTVALIGGDEREIVLCAELQRLGARVLAVGFPESRLPGAVHCRLLPAAEEARAAVVPLSGTDDRGVIKTCLCKPGSLVLTEEAFRAMAGKVLLIGSAKPAIRQLAGYYNVRLIETAENDEIAILNSIPTAEGAIAKAMAELPITLHGSNCIVTGFGRCGITLARMLAGIGAAVTVAARNPAQLARAKEMGLATAELKYLAEAVGTADCLFNTIPDLVITAQVIAALPPSALIIDIASAPGGTDFQAAKMRGIKAFHELGIPGKVAPLTAGRILADVIPRLILAACS